MTVQIEYKSSVTFSAIKHDSPKDFLARFSADGINWGDAVPIKGDGQGCQRVPSNACGKPVEVPLRGGSVTARYVEFAWLGRGRKSSGASWVPGNGVGFHVEPACSSNNAIMGTVALVAAHQLLGERSIPAEKLQFYYPRTHRYSPHLRVGAAAQVGLPPHELPIL